LVFGAFFVVVPLSNTLIRERQQGTLRRLRSTNLGSLTLLLGKLVPYFAINQLQVLLMLLAGRYLVPALGGEVLQINGSLLLLAVISSALSLCALGLALLIAVSSSTTEQATLLGGTGNIILAALGGIMIPKFLMPATMQHIARWSPMSWGLEGFLNVLLRGGNLGDIAPQALALTTLGVAAIVLAWFIQTQRTD
jgi:ABC-2 type transport system permease protein